MQAFITLRKNNEPIYNVLFLGSSRQNIPAQNHNKWKIEAFAQKQQHEKSLKL
jgi:hypothetical protein